MPFRWWKNARKVFEDFISEEEEEYILSWLDADTERAPWRESRRVTPLLTRSYALQWHSRTQRSTARRLSRVSQGLRNSSKSVLRSCSCASQSGPVPLPHTNIPTPWPPHMSRPTPFHITARCRRFNGQTRGKRYGVEMDLRLRSVSPASLPMPPWLAPFVARARALHRVLTNYNPNGARIGWGEGLARVGSARGRLAV